MALFQFLFNHDGKIRHKGYRVDVFLFVLTLFDLCCSLQFIFAVRSCIFSSVSMICIFNLDFVSVHG